MKILIASSNPDKFTEFQLLLSGTAFQLIKPPGELKVTENGSSFKANAVIKARAYGAKFKLPALADDSGLEIKALQAFPGIRSARFAKGDFPQAMAKILAR